MEKITAEEILNKNRANVLESMEEYASIKSEQAVRDYKERLKEEIKQGIEAATEKYLDTGIDYGVNTIRKAHMEDLKQLASDSFHYGAWFVIKRVINKQQDESY